ncbi:MAG: DUF692 domain-containing protein [Rhodospirillaceae bacterium]|nr:DUF692 domain-containing protein [Rhodospirillaceae bacterium]
MDGDPGLTAAPIPAEAGIGLRHPHVAAFLAGRPAIGWIEVHSENYLMPVGPRGGGPRLKQLEAIRRDYPLSCHGVGLSLGSAEGLDDAHLTRLRALFDRVQPGLVSEHLAWSVTGGVYLNDLLPLPYTDEALGVVCRNVDRAQEAFARQVLVENPSSYIGFAGSTIAEWQFLAEVSRRTGCGILLDVNNIHVSAHNHGFDPEPYLDAIPPEAVGEIHIAGHFVASLDGETVLIDDHGASVDPAVWRLFRSALARLGRRPVLVEWDTNIPALPVLLAEADKAQAILDALCPYPAVGHVA